MRSWSSADVMAFAGCRAGVQDRITTYAECVSAAAA